MDKYQQDTLAIRSGYERTHENEHAEAMFLTSSYVFESAEMAAKYFSNELQGNVYSRYTNPTVRSFEQRLAAMEEGEQCVATASGMAALPRVNRRKSWPRVPRKLVAFSAKAPSSLQEVS